MTDTQRNMTNAQRNTLAILSLAACFLNLPLVAFLYGFGVWVSILFIFHLALLGGFLFLFLYLYDDEMEGIRPTTAANAFTMAFVCTSSLPLCLASLFPIYLMIDVLLRVAEGLMGVEIYRTYEGGLVNFILIGFLIKYYCLAVKGMLPGISRIAERHPKSFWIGFRVAVVVHACWLLYAFILLVMISESH